MIGTFAAIPAGAFLMGSDTGQDDERPVHRVHVDAFLMATCPVTRGEYAGFLRESGREAPRDWHAAEFAGDDLPVVGVSWNDAVAYCAWLSITLQRSVRLPTEAEWEKAARGGVEGMKYPWGNEIDPSRCNYLSAPSAKKQRGTRPTGTYSPNPFGLCDVAGNVWEWVADWYDAEHYGESDAVDPQGPPKGSLHIVRGGSWVTDDVSMLRCAYRHAVPPDTFAYSVGFRIVCAQ